MIAVPSIFKGDIFDTKHGVATVEAYIDRKNITVRFADGSVVRTNAISLRRGTTRNPNFRNAYGIGFLGAGRYVAHDGKKTTPAYDVWRGVLRRCYDPRFQKNHPTYIGCTVSEDWHNFQNFADFYYSNTYRQEGWQLDKDLLVKGNKEYSKDKCVFLPVALNNTFLKKGAARGNCVIGVHFNKRSKKYAASVQNGGSKFLGYFDDQESAFWAYKSAKENIIKSHASDWKDKIDPRAYKALMEYQVEITD